MVRHRLRDEVRPVPLGACKGGGSSGRSCLALSFICQTDAPHSARHLCSCSLCTCAVGHAASVVLCSGGEPLMVVIVLRRSAAVASSSTVAQIIASIATAPCHCMLAWHHPPCAGQLPTPCMQACPPRWILISPAASSGSRSVRSSKNSC